MNLSYKIVHDLAQAKKIWESLSPHELIYDTWDFRYLYYKYFNYPLHFYTVFHHEEPVVLLPLMYDQKNKRLEFFGSFSYMEDNRVFSKKGYDFLTQPLIDNVTSPFNFEYLNEAMKTIKDVKIQDYDYYIDLKGMSSYNDFLVRHLAGKKKHKIKAQINKIIRELAPSIEVTDNTEYLESLANFNKARFGDNSSFNDRPFWSEYIKDICDVFSPRFTLVKIHSELKGVGLSLNYKKTTYGINSGYDQEINNFGKFMALLKIDTAIKDGQEIYDALGTSYGWKEDFNLSKRPLYQLEKTVPFITTQLNVS